MEPQKRFRTVAQLNIRKNICSTNSMKNGNWTKHNFRKWRWSTRSFLLVIPQFSHVHWGPNEQSGYSDIAADVALRERCSGGETLLTTYEMHTGDIVPSSLDGQQQFTLSDFKKINGNRAISLNVPQISAYPFSPGTFCAENVYAEYFGTLKWIARWPGQWFVGSDFSESMFNISLVFVYVIFCTSENPAKMVCIIKKNRIQNVKKCDKPKRSLKKQENKCINRCKAFGVRFLHIFEIFFICFGNIDKKRIIINTVGAKKVLSFDDSVLSK